MGKIHSPLIPTQHIPKPVGAPAGGGSKPASIPMNKKGMGK